MFYRYYLVLRRTFTKLDIIMFTIVYTTLVRTRLENCVQVASLSLKGDWDILGNVLVADNLQLLCYSFFRILL